MTSLPWKILVQVGASLLATATLFLAADASLRLSRRLAPRAGVATRLCAGLVVVLWLAEAGFAALIVFGAFRLVPGCLFWLLLDLFARWLEPEGGIVDLASELKARLETTAAPVTTL